ncbi:MAG: nuclear transport factor 2 family protein [Bacteroidota bacterium]
MKQTLLLFICCLSLSLQAQSETEAIKETLQKYLKGSSYSEPQINLEAFYEEADLFLYKEGEDIFLWTPQQYATAMGKREQGKYNGREGTILDLDYANNIATAKAEIYTPKANLRFIDMFLLKKLDGQWKIISKAATKIEE